MTEQPGAAIRVELIDDHVMVRAALRMLLERDGRCLVVAEAGNGADAVAAAARERPDVIVLDLDLGAESGLDSLRSIREAAPGARVLVLTGLRDTELHQRAIRLGAVGVLSKEHAPQLLMKAIVRVHAGESWLDRATTAALLAELSQGAPPKQANPDEQRIATLTSREREVLALIAQGFRNKEVAERLHISEATVRHHLTAVFAKLGVTDRMGAMLFAFRHGLVPRSRP